MATYYVSTTGSDLNDGLSLTQSFATLERARDAMRASSGEDTTLIRAGTYEVTNVLQLNGNDNGSSFAAYNNESVTLSGGTAIKNWVEGVNGVWTAQINQAELNQLTLNGVRMTEARFPNAVPDDPRQGWLFAKEPPPGIDTRKQIAFDAADFPPGTLAPGMEVHIFTNYSWGNQINTISSVDWQNKIITFEQPTAWDMGSASRFFVQGSAAHMDKPGEWWFDKLTSTIHFKAPSGFDGTGAVASGLDAVINIDGAENISVKGMRFTDMASSGEGYVNDAAAITLTFGKNIDIVYNVFTNVERGVYSRYLSENINISGNDFFHLLGSAIHLGHQSKNNIISNNSIYKTGEIFTTYGAIQMDENSGNLVSNNLIRDVPRIGIEGLNYDSALASGGNTIEYNIVMHSSQITSDSGAIYFYSASDNTHTGEIIRNNIVVDTGGLETTAGGFLPGFNYTNSIYLDDNTSRATVTGNFLQGSVVGGIYLHGGSFNDVNNNVVIDNKYVGIQNFDIGKPMTGNNVYNNLVEVPWLSGGFAVQANNQFAVPPATLHDNFFYNPQGRPISFQQAYDTKTLAEWQALGYDLGSDVISSGLFVDPASGNYVLKPGSLPLLQGFTQLPMAEMQSFRSGVVKWGGDNADSLSGTSGDDLLDGLAGGDTLTGGLGNDTLVGGAGNDLLAGGLGADILIGGADNDTADYSAHTFGVSINLSAGKGAGDTLSEIENIWGSAFGDQLYGDAGANTIKGGSGNDLIIAGNGADFLNGEGDLDTVSYQTATAGVFVNIGTGVGANGGVLANIENVTGSDFGDVLHGDNGSNTIKGGGGNDYLFAGNGADYLVGGADLDTVTYETATAAVYANIGTGTGANGGVLQEIENLTGSAFGDVLFGDATGNTLKGGDGNDLLVGGGGSDALYGGADADYFRYDAAGFGNDVIVDFQDNLDKLSFNTTIATSFANLTIANNGTTNVSVSVAGQTIAVQGLANITLTASDFLFV